MILARLQAGLGAGVALVIFGLHTLSPALIPDTTLLFASAAIGVAAAIYFATIHRVLRRNHLELSALILTCISAINIILVIVSTGGLDSPFYSFWLLAIVVSGIFGLSESLAVLGLTIGYYALVVVMNGLSTQFIFDHLIQFCITLAAAGLAEWVHIRSRKEGADSAGIEKLAGQLTTEQLKADAIMSSIGEGVMVIDSTKKIQLFNKAAQELTGWDESSAQSIDYNLVMQLKTSDDQPVNEFNDPFMESWKKQAEVVKDNLVMTTRSGRKVQLSISISPIFDDKHQPNGAIALFRDISAEKEVGRQKDEFISTASHEMRTPVAAIEGYISLAMNANVATIDDRAMKYLTKAHDTIGHLGELFRDLLSVTKAEEGQLGGRMEASNVGQLIEHAVDDMQFTLQKKNLTLVYQIGNQTGKAISPLFYVAANPERLREVIMNLIDNAMKFTPEGGIRVVLEGNDKEVTVSINDTGVGIAQEDIAHLFQKFYRIDNSATRTIGGTGLGLYLCRNLIEAYNGRIWVESKPGEGSSFRFTLPRLTEAEVVRLQQAPTTPGAQQPGGTVTPETNHTAPAPSVPPPAPAPEPTPAPIPVPVDAPKPLPAVAMPIPGSEDSSQASVSAPAVRGTDLSASRRIR